MKILSRSLVALVLVAVGGSALGLAAADTNPPPAPHHRGHPGERFDPERRLARLTEKLGLTTEQQAQLRPIFATQAEEMKKIDATPLTADQRREKMRALHKEDRARIAAILTPEQRAKFTEMRPKGPKGPRDGQPGGE
jgi:Spy/CpxP family protein refolding chaperone